MTHQTCGRSERRLSEGDNYQSMEDRFNRVPYSWVRATCSVCSRDLWWEVPHNAVVRWPAHSVPTPESAGH